VYENLAAGDGLSDEKPLELGKVLRRQVADGFTNASEVARAAPPAFEDSPLRTAGPRLPTVIFG